MDLPEPRCPWGYPYGQVRTILGSAKATDDFHEWMNGQAQTICDGREYDHEAWEYKPTACADSPHGMVVYPWDLERYVRLKEDGSDSSN